MTRMSSAAAALIFTLGTVVIATPALDRQTDAAIVASATQPVARG